MRNFKKLSLTALGVIALSATSAFAQDSVGFVSSIDGDVLIERNGELLKAQPNSAIMPGDRITATKGANAVVNFGNCTSSIASQATALVTMVDGPCGAGLNFTAGAGASGVGGGAVGGGAGGLLGSPALLLAGAGAVALAAVALSDDDPASP
jgi:hypothetical protein